jgi:fatty acid photodecarboxylase
VLLTAGVYASPQLLMLSGVGPAAHLAGHGIPVVADAPAVGQNLQDHAAVMLSYESRDPQKDKRRSGVFYTEATGRTPGSLLNYLFRGKGPLTSPMCEAGGFVKTDPAHDSCDLQLRFIPFFSEPDPYASLADFAQGGAYLSNKSNRPAGFTLQSVVARPRSRGTVALASADVRDRVSIAANWMSDAADMATLTAGLKLSRKVAAQAPFADYRGAERYPGAAASSDADLEAYVRDSCHTANAMVGTCRMGDDAGSVVDTELRVRGVANLRVVDSSVMPTLPGGQSGAPTMVIAERAADLIKQAAAATA